MGKAVEYMIRDILIESNSTFKIAESINDVSRFINFTDDIINTIKITENNNLKNAKNLINRLDTRNFYKFIDEYIIPKDRSNNLNKIKPIDILSYNSSNIDINDIIVYDKKINYNYSDKNPVDNVYFYDNNNLEYKYKMPKDNISLLLPDVFEERIIRLYSKLNNNKINNLLKNAFNNYIKQYK